MSDRLPLPLDPPAMVRVVEDVDTLLQEAGAEWHIADNDTSKGMDGYRKVGEKLLHAKRKSSHGKWAKALAKANLPFGHKQACKYMRLAREWQQANFHSDGNLTLDQCMEILSSNDHVEEEKLSEYVTLDQWADLDRTERQDLLATEGDRKFNDQKDNDSIEWSLWSWNPVTGCQHNCPYCYARDIAERFYEQKFVPSLWPNRLKAPQNTTFPADKAADWMGHKNVFVCSMADLFGRWVPREWIDAVLSEVRAAPQWNFLFLTKFPIRMAEFDFPDNAWVGATVDCQARVANAERAFRKVKAGVKWLSCEPLIEPLRFQDLGAFSWLVLGGASKSTQTPEWHPPRAWVATLKDEAKRLGIPVYEKSNLLLRERGYPGCPAVEATEAPAVLQYLPKDAR